MNKNIFTKHLNLVGESYFKHFLKAISFSFTLLLLSIKSIIHAFLPFLCINSVSEKIKVMHEDLQKRKNNPL